MKQIILSLYGLSLCGCALISSQNRTSDWAVLDEALDVSCDSWPLRELDLGVSEFTVLKGENKVGFLVDMKRRNGSRIFYYHDFKGETDIEPGETNKLIFGRSGVPLKGEFAGTKKNVAVIRNKSETESILEIHDLKTNIVQRTSTKIADKILAGTITNAVGGYWVVLEGDDHRVSYVEHKSKSALLPVRSFPKAKYATKPALVPNRDSKLAHLISFHSDVKEDGTSDDSFKIMKLMSNGKQGEAERLKLPTEAGVETWAAQTTPGGVKLAYIEGDSLVGQANLRLAKIKLGRGNSNIEWNKEILLENIHLSEPLWVPTPGAQVLLMLKWVDGESTLAAYKVGMNGVESTKNFGVFSKGSAVIDAFSYGENNEIYAILRRKIGYRWNFDICKLGEID